jgi:acyl-CoA dehydrogenase
VGIITVAGTRCSPRSIDAGKGFAGVMQTFDNTRPLVAAMAVGVARASLELTRSLLADAGVVVDYDRTVHLQPAAAAAYLQMESDWEAAYLLTLQAAWMADNGQPNSLQASMAKAKAGRTANDITLRCRELTGTLGYSEHHLLEKWARDSKSGHLRGNPADPAAHRGSAPVGEDLC